MGIKVAIFGATGKIGKEVNSQLQNQNLAGNIEIDEIHCIGRTQEKVEASANEVRTSTEILRNKTGIPVDFPGGIVEMATRPEAVEGLTNPTIPTIGQVNDNRLKNPRSTTLDTKEELDVIVIAAAGRKPPQEGDKISRTGSININAGIMHDVTAQINEYLDAKPERRENPPHIVVVTNPVDAMAMHVQEQLGIPKERISGAAGLIDEERLRYLAAEAIGVEQSEVTLGNVLGEHGKKGMLPLVEYLVVKGQPITEYLADHPVEGRTTNELFEGIIEATKNEGGKINKDQGRIGAYYAPAGAIVSVIESIAHDGKRDFKPMAPITCSSWSEEHQCYMGQIAQIDKSGVHPISNAVELAPEAEKVLEAAATSIKQNRDVLALQHALLDYQPLEITKIVSSDAPNGKAWHIKTCPVTVDGCVLERLGQDVAQVTGKETVLVPDAHDNAIYVANLPPHLDKAMDGIADAVHLGGSEPHPVIENEQIAVSQFNGGYSRLVQALAPADNGHHLG